MKNVVVTGVGIKSCIGNTYDEVLHSLQNGKSGISAINLMLIWVLEARYQAPLI